MTGSRPAFIGNLTDGLEPFDDGGFPDMGGKGNRLGHRLGLTRGPWQAWFRDPAGNILSVIQD